MSEQSRDEVVEKWAATWDGVDRTSLKDAKPGVDYVATVCGRPECSCSKPGRPCEEFLRLAETAPWCPRCGWARRWHPVGASDEGGTEAEGE